MAGNPLCHLVISRLPCVVHARVFTLPAGLRLCRPGIPSRPIIPPRPIVPFTIVALPPVWVIHFGLWGSQRWSPWRQARHGGCMLSRQARHDFISYSPSPCGRLGGLGGCLIHGSRSGSMFIIMLLRCPIGNMTPVFLVVHMTPVFPLIRCGRHFRSAPIVPFMSTNYFMFRDEALDMAPVLGEHGILLLMTFTAASLFVFLRPCVPVPIPLALLSCISHLLHLLEGCCTFLALEILENLSIKTLLFFSRLSHCSMPSFYLILFTLDLFLSLLILIRHVAVHCFTPLLPVFMIFCTQTLLSASLVFFFTPLLSPGLQDTLRQGRLQV